MEPFNLLHAVALPIAQANFDTDQILPARYLQKPRSENFGHFLFRDLRLRADGETVPEFVLNQAPYKPARIVVAEHNFACGSSREHAVWALYDYGVRAVIAPSYGDIFMSNAAKNGLLTIVLPTAVVADLIGRLQAVPGMQLTIALDAQTVALPDGETHTFEIDPYLKQCLRDGLDELGYTLTQLDKIVSFESRYAY